MAQALRDLHDVELAGLAAGLQHTIDDDEFLTASAVMPNSLYSRS